MSTIRYFLPEDGDTEESPNVFLAPKSQRAGYPPLLSQIKNAFPLPGSYHFRFKTPLIPGSDREKNAIPVWMDCCEEEEPVPTWQGGVFAKVSRIAMDGESYYEEQSSFDAVESNVSTGGYSSSRSSMSKPQSTPNFSQQSSDHSLLGAFDDGPTTTATNTAPAAPSSGNLFDAHPPASGGSLLDMDHIAPTPSSGVASGYNSSGANTPTPHDELLNMTAPMPTTAGHSVQQQQHRPVPMQSQYPMQGMSASMPQQRMGMMPQGMGMQQQNMQQQQFNQSNRVPAANNMNGAGAKNAFDQFSGNSLDPLGNLKWS